MNAGDRGRAGFSLVEVLVALVVLEVGLVGCAGTLVMAHRHMTAAERLHLATQAAASVADSLLVADRTDAGEAAAWWGRVRWSEAGGGLLLRAEEPAGALLLEWWIPFASGT